MATQVIGRDLPIPKELSDSSLQYRRSLVKLTLRPSRVRKTLNGEECQLLFNQKIVVILCLKRNKHYRTPYLGCMHNGANKATTDSGDSNNTSYFLYWNCGVEAKWTGYDGRDNERISTANQSSVHPKKQINKSV